MEHEAILYDRDPDGTVHCRLCPHRCSIRPGKRGVCRVRENRDGVLLSLVYGKLVAENVDPIEKKPLYHYLPGTLSYSIATAGCNLSCSHCQNHHISREAPRMNPIPGLFKEPGEVVSSALRTGCRSIAYTYTEPTIFMEFARDCGLRAREVGLGNVFVTNGFMTAQAREVALSFLDAANVDLKGATEEHYRTVCGASLAPVLETIEDLHRSGIWIEVTTLLIPGLNDDVTSLRFIASFLASINHTIPWHVSRFFPTYRMLDRPPTPIESLQRALDIGREQGLKHVYLGNVAGVGEETFCSSCNSSIIRRTGYNLDGRDLDDEGRCLHCRAPFDGIPGKKPLR